MFSGNFSGVVADETSYNACTSSLLCAWVDDFRGGSLESNQARNNRLVRVLDLQIDGEGMEKVSSFSYL